MDDTDTEHEFEIKVVNDEHYPLIVLIDTEGVLTLRHQFTPMGLVGVLEQLTAEARRKARKFAADTS